MPTIRFLLGPAGSGKTHRCLEEIRAELVRDPGGPRLMLLAPKQATFQLERQLLEGGGVTGWTRLEILSFERLARQILEEAGECRVLSEDGRVMVLRALLRRNQERLRTFRSTARLTGFAQELSEALREIQRQGVGADRLEALAREPGRPRGLVDKLADLALMLREYRGWLKAHGLRDAETLPDLAAERLKGPGTEFEVDEVWMDGFAEMTPQEVGLLVALAGRSRRVTLAFCADRPFAEEARWLSIWAVLSQTYRRLYTRLVAEPGWDVGVEVLERCGETGRYAAQPVLQHLEAGWQEAAVAPESVRTETETGDEGALRLVECPDFEAEAEVAAREVWRQVRAGGRFRDLAVLVRSLDATHGVLQRVFGRYRIPCFIDQRAPLAHHPLAELTRSAVRVAAYGWRLEDWLGVLKSGLTPVSEAWVDRLENEALRLGWDGEIWRGWNASTAPMERSGAEEVEAGLDPVRRLVAALGTTPEAGVLAGALRALWSELRVAERLETWAETAAEDGGSGVVAGVHRSAMEQMMEWLSNLERGFGGERLPLAEWLPILEAGLATLTAGAIPPCLDQVLIGAIDRSRQPDLGTALVLGLNDGMFPGRPVERGVFTALERDLLEKEEAGLLPDRRRRLGHERYFGYIALTRARRRLVLTWSERDGSGRAMHRSPIVEQVLRMFPGLRVVRALEEELASVDAAGKRVVRVEHEVEWLPWLLAHPGAVDLGGWRPCVSPGVRAALAGEVREDRLGADVVRQLYGEEPLVSVTALEAVAACPFQGWVRQGLRARERERFEVDPRRTGTLIHAALAGFHQGVMAENRRWRDLTGDEARQRMDGVLARVVAEEEGGRFTRSAEVRWRVEGLRRALRELVATLVSWAKRTAFDPRVAEWAFGEETGAPAWRIEVESGRWIRLRGKADRVDLCGGEGGGWEYLVVDYKLGERKVDEALMRAGIDLQLAAYALAIEALKGAGLPVGEGGGGMRPAGMFFVRVLDRPKRATGWKDCVGGGDNEPRLHVHRGRFRTSAVDRLDPERTVEPSGQYQYLIKKDGKAGMRGDAVDDAEFEGLLGAVGEAVRTLGLQMHRGEVSVRPYRKGNLKACDRCDLRAVCRFDAWTQAYRALD